MSFDVQLRHGGIDKRDMIGEIAQAARDMQATDDRR